MLKQLLINFHDLIGLEISSEREGFLSYFAKEYEHYISHELAEDKPRVKLHIETRGFTFDDDGEFTDHIHKVLARWKYRIKFQPGLIDITAATNFFGLSMIHHMLVHPAIRVLCAKQDVLMLHAGAVCLNDESILVTGSGGTGKTTTTSLLLSQPGADYALHADDYVFITRSNSLSYMTRSHLYHDIVNWVPEISSRLTLKERVKLWVFGLLRKWTAEGIKWPTRISANRLWPTRTLCNRGKIKGLIYLSKGKAINQPTLVQVEETDQIRNAILDMNFSEAEHFVNLLEKDKFVSDITKWLEEWRRLEHNLLNRFLEDVPLYQLKFPRRTDLSADYKDRVLAEIGRLTMTSGETDAI